MLHKADQLTPAARHSPSGVWWDCLDACVREVRGDSAHPRSCPWGEGQAACAVSAAVRAVVVGVGIVPQLSRG